VVRAPIKPEGRLVSEDGVEIEDDARSGFIHDRVPVHVSSGAPGRRRRQTPLHFIRQRLYSSLPSSWKLASPVILLRQAGRQRALVVILANHAQMLVAETGFAIAAMPVAIVIIPPVLPPVVVVMVFRSQALSRESHASGRSQDYPCSHSFLL
jgi:hypothetical protein